MKDMKELQVLLDTTKREFVLRIPLLPADCLPDDKIQNTDSPAKRIPSAVNILSMQRAAETCTFLVNGERGQFQRKFSYGFGCNFDDDTSLLEVSVSTRARSICMCFGDQFSNLGMIPFALLSSLRTI